MRLRTAFHSDETPRCDPRARLRPVSASAWTEIERALGASGLGAALDARRAAGPDPVGAATRAADLLRAAAEADREPLAAVARRDPDTVARVLRGACAIAPFLTRFLRVRPGWLAELARDDLRAPRTPEAVAARLEAALAGVDPEGEADALRRFKYFELARIVAGWAS